MRRFLSGLLLAVTAMLLLGTGPAAALDLNPFNNDCKPQLVVGTPESGPANGIDGGPKHPHDGDPFAKNPTTSVYEKYGYGGLTWPSFDCGLTDLGAVTDPGGSATGSIANIMLGGLTLVVALVVSIVRFAFAPGTLDIFDPIMTLAADALGDNVFKALFWVTLCATGLLILRRSTAGRFAESARSFGWVTFAGLLGLAATVWPLVVAPTVDHLLTSTIGTVNKQLANAQGTTADTAADGMAANIHHALLYETWCSGMVGRSAGDTADKFCPEFWVNSHISRSEYDQAQKAADPTQAMNDLVKKKGDAFTQAADDLKKTDPVAYSFLTGNHNSDRVMYALLAWFGFLCASPFLLMSAILLIYALVVVRLAIMVLPAIVVVGGFPPLRQYVVAVFDYVMAAVFTALLFGAMSAVFVAMIGGFMAPSSGINPILTMLLLGITTVAAWKFTKPFRRVKHMANIKARMKSRGSLDRDGDGIPASQEGGPKGKPGSGGGIFTPQGTPGYWSKSTPAEAAPSMFGSALKGAAQGAATTAALGLVSGGTITAAGMAAGAARGAAISAGAAKFGTAGALTGMAVSQGIGAGATSPRPTSQPYSVGGGEPAPMTPMGGGGGRHAALPAGTGGVEDVKPRVFTPGEQHPAENARVVEPTLTEQGERVYTLYAPEPKGGAK